MEDNNEELDVIMKEESVEQDPVEMEDIYSEIKEEPSVDDKGVLDNAESSVEEKISIPEVQESCNISEDLEVSIDEPKVETCEISEKVALDEETIVDSVVESKSIEEVKVEMPPEQIVRDCPSNEEDGLIENTEVGSDPASEKDEFGLLEVMNIGSGGCEVVEESLDMVGIEDVEDEAAQTLAVLLVEEMEEEEVQKLVLRVVKEVEVKGLAAAGELDEGTELAITVSNGEEIDLDLGEVMASASGCILQSPTSTEQVKEPVEDVKECQDRDNQVQDFAVVVTSQPVLCDEPSGTDSEASNIDGKASEESTSEYSLPASVTTVPSSTMEIPPEVSDTSVSPVVKISQSTASPLLPAITTSDSPTVSCTMSVSEAPILPAPAISTAAVNPSPEVSSQVNLELEVTLTSESANSTETMVTSTVGANPPSKDSKPPETFVLPSQSPIPIQSQIVNIQPPNPSVLPQTSQAPSNPIQFTPSVVPPRKSPPPLSIQPHFLPSGTHSQIIPPLHHIQPSPPPLSSHQLIASVASTPLTVTRTMAPKTAAAAMVVSSTIPKPYMAAAASYGGAGGVRIPGMAQTKNQTKGKPRGDSTVGGGSSSRGGRNSSSSSASASSTSGAQSGSGSIKPPPPPPPGAVNLERSYQICQAVIQNSPNRDQLRCQLKPPPSSLLPSLTAATASGRGGGSANSSSSTSSNSSSSGKKATQYSIVTSTRMTGSQKSSSATSNAASGAKSSRSANASNARQSSSPVVVRHVYNAATGTTTTTGPVPVTMALMPQAMAAMTPEVRRPRTLESPSSSPSQSSLPSVPGTPAATVALHAQPHPLHPHQYILVQRTTGPVEGASGSNSLAGSATRAALILNHQRVPTLTTGGHGGNINGGTRLGPPRASSAPPSNENISVALQRGQMNVTGRGTSIPGIASNSASSGTPSFANPGRPASVDSDYAAQAVSGQQVRHLN
ncbi:hypothetical protein J437_LFUL011377 [Ladona fulva]|uniref:Uncharacterized protein n=1 Tax=Ladona fulva TaxID=123851 RepID=A0A8K0KCM8_LADFU|nr:hypothetical protein J437_LFUL011377 [Ladona fulva]